ncbi:MAG: hypothetical protein LUC83_02565, partial [Clostridiales bacterium]|nr:hypothetical protein [Clostridiales bacterium]
MKEYTSESPQFSDSITIPETTDTNHADNINAATKQLHQNTLVLKSASLPPEYDSTSTYSAGDYVTKDGVTYRALVDVPEGEWDASLWTETNLYKDSGNGGATAELFKIFMIGAIPNYYNRESLFTPNQTSITIHANTQVNINGNGYCSTEDVTLSTADVKEAGKDIYIYACVPESGTVPNFVLSQNSTVPDGYDADTSRKIGGFHCLCLAVGTISGHTLSGYATADILPCSVWDLKHRPVSDPEGMVYDEGTGRWYDIYLASWDGSQLVSEYGAATADGASSEIFHGHKFREKMGLVGKRLLWRHEFMVVAKGSNEGTAISGAADPVTTGGHVDSAGRRMISNIGLEDCCGALWQWVNDEYENLITGTSASAATPAYWHTSNGYAYFSGYNWSTLLDTTHEYSVSNYNSTVDDEEMGDTYGLPRQARVGAGWSDSSHCGSRAL